MVCTMWKVWRCCQLKKEMKVWSCCILKNYSRKCTFVWHSKKIFADEDAPSKLAKVEIPSSQLGGAAVPGTLGIALPQPALGAMQPVYVFRNLF